MSTIVFKFGGASVKDAPSIKRVCQIIEAKRSEKTLVVISALGKTTNALEAIVHTGFRQAVKTHSLVQDLKERHLEICHALFETQDSETHSAVSTLIVELEKKLESTPRSNFDFFYDQIVSFGELLSTSIIAGYAKGLGLPVAWKDARKSITTNNHHREALIDWEKTARQVEQNISADLQNQIIITQGFIGSCAEGTTTLGREGSDFTASIFTNLLDAEKLVIWKDVEGVLTADPREFQEVQKIDHLPYYEANVHFKDGTKVPKKTEVVYLGCSLNQQTDYRRELGKRIQNCMATLKKLDIFWLHSNCPARIKIITLDAVIRSKLLYGMESAKLGETELKRLDNIHLKAMRKNRL